MSESYTCKECGFNLWLPIAGPDPGSDAGLQISHIGLYNDGRFPGRSLLVLEHHEEELSKLSEDELFPFMLDVQRAGNAIQKAVGAARMNYAILGNAVPHVHCHIIPRFEDGIDPGHKTTPWSTKAKSWQMEKSKVDTIIASIQKELI